MTKHKTPESMLQHARHAWNDAWARWQVLEAVENELARVTRGERFVVYNDIVWAQLVDSRRILSINLASLGKHFYEASGGLLTNLAAQTGRIGKKVENNRALRRLFPQAARDARRVHCSDFQPIKDEVEALVSDVQSERHPMAHPYDSGAGKKRTTTADGLDLSTLKLVVRRLHEVLADLEALYTGQAFAMAPTNHVANRSRTAEDLIDLILLGSRRSYEIQVGISKDMKRAGCDWPYLYRARYYESLHIAQSTETADKVAFNARKIQQAVFAGMTR